MPYVQALLSTTNAVGTGLGGVVLGAQGQDFCGIQVAGTFSGTLQFEGAVDGVTYTSLLMTAIDGSGDATSTTAVGQWTANVGGLSSVRVRFSAFSSGKALVTIQTQIGGTVTFGVTVETATDGALSGDGSSGDKLAVNVDGTTIEVNGSNQLKALGAAVAFKTIAVSGQSSIVADAADDTLTIVAGSNITLTTNAGTDTLTIAASGGGGGGGGAAPWDSGTSYTVGQVVLDRGGIWQATGSNTNSEPISGNTDWTLIGGRPYVTVTLTAADIATLNSVPFQLVPAPGDGWILHPELSAWAHRALGVFTGSGRTGNFLLGTGVKIATGYQESVAFDLPLSLLLESTDQYGETPLLGSQSGSHWWGSPSNFENLALFIQASAGFTSTSGIPTAVSISGDSPGSGYYAGEVVVDADGTLMATVDTVDSVGAILTFTVTDYGTTPYAVGDDEVSLVAVSTLAITAVNQGTQAFSMAGNQTAKFFVGGQFNVTGSTGNDGTYTVVTATFAAGSTVIVAVEAIPDATADGAIQPGSLGYLNIDAVHNGSTLDITTYYFLVPA